MNAVTSFTGCILAEEKIKVKGFTEAVINLERNCNLFVIFGKIWYIIVPVGDTTLVHYSLLLITLSKKRKPFRAFFFCVN